ncbi:hypothetical protein JCM10212_006704 [Sporobolomyces blumeae]
MSVQPRPSTCLTGDGNDGFPSELQFREQMEDYLGGLNPKKRAKALMSREMYATILAVLLEPHSTAHATAQFRFWAKRMFRLVTTPHANLVAHENRPVAVKDQIYHILVGCHGDTNHSGRDKTSAQVRRYYSWLPKELVSRFVKMCPTCIHKRRQQQPYLSDAYVPPGTFGVTRRIGVVSAHAKGYGDDEADSPEQYDSQSAYPGDAATGGGGEFAAYTPTRRSSGESDVYGETTYDETHVESSPTNYLNGGATSYANFFLQDGTIDDASLYALPVPPPTQETPTRRDGQVQQEQQQFVYQDETGQTYVYDASGALVPQVNYAGLAVPSDFTSFSDAIDPSLQQPHDLSDYSSWQLPPPEVDSSLEYPPGQDFPAQVQPEIVYELPPLPASAPPFQLTHFPDASLEPRRDSMPTLDQTARSLEHSYQSRSRDPSQRSQEPNSRTNDLQPLGLALYTESPTSSAPVAPSNPAPPTIRRAKPPPLDLGKSSNLFPTGLDPAFRRSATTGVPQYLSANYTLDQGAPLSAPLQRTANSQFNSFRDMLPSPGPSSACSTTSTIFSTASSLPLTPGTSYSTQSDAAQSAMGCPDSSASWQNDSEQLEQAIRLLYDSHIETSGGGGPVVVQSASSLPHSSASSHQISTQPQPMHEQHDALLAHFLGAQVNLENFDDGMFAFSGAPTTMPSLAQHHQHPSDVGPEEDDDDDEGDFLDDGRSGARQHQREGTTTRHSASAQALYTPDRLRRERMRTRTVSAGPSMGRAPSSFDYASIKMGTAVSAPTQGHSVSRTPTKDLRYMPY